MREPTTIFYIKRYYFTNTLAIADATTAAQQREYLTKQNRCRLAASKLTTIHTKNKSNTLGAGR